MTQAHKKDAKASRLGRVLAHWPFLLLTLGLLALLLRAYFRDGPLPDDSWLRPHITQGGGPRNALAVFYEEFTAHALKLGTSAASKDDVLPPDVFGVVNLDSDVMKVLDNIADLNSIQRFADNNQHVDEMLARLISSDLETWRAPSSPLSHFWNLDFHLDAWSRMRVAALVHRGQAADAVKEALRFFQLGRGLESAEGEVSQWRLGMVFQWVALSELRYICTHLELDDALLRRADDALEQWELRAQDMRKTWQVDYLERPHYWTPEGRGDWFWDMCEELTARHSLLNQLAVRPNDTSTLFLQSLQPLFAASEVDWPSFAEAQQSLAVTAQYLKPSKAMDYFQPNLIGREMVELTLRRLALRREPLWLVAKTREARIMLALQRYELTQGHLPSNLEALVPRYLRSVPEQVCSRKPPRWFKASRSLQFSEPDLVGPETSPTLSTMEAYWWPELLTHSVQHQATSDDTVWACPVIRLSDFQRQ